MITCLLCFLAFAFGFFVAGLTRAAASRKEETLRPFPGQTVSPAGAATFVGCPWQKKNPEDQQFECVQLVAFQLLYERTYGPMSTACMGEACEVWRAFHRQQELARGLREQFFKPAAGQPGEKEETATTQAAESGEVEKSEAAKP